MTAKRWARGLITKLLQMTHRQWLIRNAKVHIKQKGDLTTEEHDDLLQKMETLLWMDPEHLLSDDRHLLEEDFELLGQASALDQQLWVAEVEAAISAADYAAPQEETHNTRSPSGAEHTNNNTPRDVTDELGSEGSGAWRRKRWR
jgi:hypothetical protein